MTEAVIIRNSRVALFCAFAVGLGTGVLAGASLVRRALTEEFNIKIEEEFERLQAQYNMGGIVKKPWANPQEAVAELHPEATVTKPRNAPGFEEPPARTPFHYDKVVEFQPGAEAPEDIDPEEEHAIEAEYGVEEAPDIYFVTAEVFAANDKEFHQESLWYYPLDNVVATQRDDKVEDWQKFLGPEFHRKFGEDPSDPNSVYICNEKLKILYEITLATNGSFQNDVVLGLMGEEVEENIEQRINGA